MKPLKVIGMALLGVAIFVSSLPAGVTISATHTTTAKPDEKQINKTYVDSGRCATSRKARARTPSSFSDKTKVCFG